MHRFSRRILCYRRPTQTRARPYDVFINHRGIDTKRSVAGLLYDNLTRLKLHPFMDIKNMNPGDKLFEKIDGAIRTCKVGVAVLSPHYCESYFCLHELTSLLELEKKVIPIFVDIKPSELQIIDNGSYGVKELQRFRWALEEAKYTVGLTFDSCNGSGLLKRQGAEDPAFALNALLKTEEVKEAASEEEPEEPKMGVLRLLNDVKKHASPKAFVSEYAIH
ncbi:hypothetical protein HHK36_003727 [Tetracentron sinense]|uniref:TIR domain-containing protein n=1 Tax=Tetracentron sinense TaxID=13715 RepID=A0A835DSF1_TETSI|nr:hypothetical protein HHK36_003727 [Tetracentron sinense]